MRAVAITAAVALLAWPSIVRANPAEGAAAALLEELGAADAGRVEDAVAGLERTRQGDPDVLYVAARACETRLLDPRRALAIYERVVTEFPAARAAAAAGRRADELRALIGARGEYAALAAELAQLSARGDAEPAQAVIARAERLAGAAWPGAPAAGLWLADWLRRAARFEAAQAHYAAVIARWPQSEQAQAALRGATGCALDARNWDLAERLAQRLPAAEPADRALRNGQLAAAARGRHRELAHGAAWLGLLAAIAGLLGSLVEAALRSPAGARWQVLRPPIEVVYLAPVALVLSGVAVTAHRLIAPAVATISIGGVALAWLSGAALERLRAGDRARRLRSVAHVLACLIAVAALGYIAITRDHLLDMLIETVRFGPDA